MPYLKKTDKHVCPICKHASIRTNMKVHLATPKKIGGPRCPGLKKVIPSDVWKKDILPYYTKNAKLPDLQTFGRNDTTP